MRTLIYARYSSDLQNSRSVASQVADCRARCEAEGWPVVDVFSDHAISGAAGTGESQRPGLNALLARIEAGGIEQVVADTTSRIARNQGDNHHIRDLINFHGARLFTLADGEVDAFKGAIKGLLDEHQRKELAHNIKRGQADTVREGRAPAGLAYGYRVANRLDGKGGVVRGLREIDPDQAPIVLRIFTEYADGQSPAATCKRLNAEQVPAPRGGTWRGSTLNGDRQRQNGMLQNRLYAGEIVHNRTSKLTDPRTRKTVIRPNPEAAWHRESVPELRIVPEDLWDRVQRRRGAYEGKPAERCRRPRHLLSGLGICGICGGGWSLIGSGKGRHGQWGCGRHNDGGGCTNNRRIETASFEERVLGGLRERMLDPRAVALFVKEYHAERSRAAGEMARDRSRLEAERADAAGRIDRLVAAIERGADVEEVHAALLAARAVRDEAERELAKIASLVEGVNVVALHPRIVDDYREQIEQLTAALADPYASIEAVPKLRSLIERIVVTPSRKKKGTSLRLEGRLANLLSLAAGRDLDLSESTAKAERVKGSGRYRTFAAARI